MGVHLPSESRPGQSLSPKTSVTRRARFLALSIALTGDAALPPHLVAGYLQRVDHSHPGEVDALLAAFEAGLAADGDPDAAIRARVTGDAALWATSREVISVWLTSRLPAVDRVAPEIVDPAQYFQSRLWTTIRAHPPGVSGGYFGHWHYEPEH